MFDEDDCFGSAPGTRVAGQSQSADLASAHCLTAAVLLSLPVALPPAALSMAALPRLKLVTPFVQEHSSSICLIRTAVAAHQGARVLAQPQSALLDSVQCLTAAELI